MANATPPSAPVNGATATPAQEKTPEPNNTKQKIKPTIVARFPEKLGENNDMPYMLIKIFETQTGFIESNDELSRTVRAGGGRVWDTVDKVLASDTSKGAVAGLLLGGSIGSAVAGGALGAAANTILQQTDKFLDTVFGADVDYVSQAKNMISKFSLKRNSQQLSSMLALYMPEGMVATYDQDYEGISVTQALGAVGFLAQAAGSSSTSKTGKVDGVNPYLAEGISSLAGKFMGEQIGKLGTYASTGFVVNPQIELLYTSPVLRKFTFDFKLVPKSATEAKLLFGSVVRGTDPKEIDVQDLGIIGMLKYYSAPKLVENVGGRYFIPPAQFQLEFWRPDFKGGQTINENLFRTKNCVLESINLDFSPNGFATHHDGVPVEVRMQLTFQETVMLDRGAILAGY